MRPSRGQLDWGTIRLSSYVLENRHDDPAVTDSPGVTGTATGRTLSPNRHNAGRTVLDATTGRSTARLELLGD